MCTVALVPWRGQGYLLGHNRDEILTRARGIPPSRREHRGRIVLAPHDPEGGGTWIAVNDAGLTLCLLNGAETNPARLPASPRSRGLLLQEMLQADSIPAVVSGLQAVLPRLGEFRAFHLLIVEAGRASGRARVLRMQWDGVMPAWSEHEGACLFVSSSLDPAGVERERGASWRALLAREGVPDPTTMARWLASHDPRPGPLTVCMHRPLAGTVSRTIVSVGAEGTEMRYHDGPPCNTAAAEVHLAL